METPTFKKGDRVRLKAWVTKPKLAGADNLLPHGRVGICKEGGIVHIGNNAIPYVDVQTPELPKARRAIVAIEDLELMPERQVHVVKDGKVYELRKGQGDVVGVGDCCHCAFNGVNCSKTHPSESCLTSWSNYQEVKSGKLVS